MKTLNVKFNGKEYKIRDNWASKRIFQEAVKNDKSILENNEDVIVFFSYAVLLGYNKDFDMDFDEFTQVIDDEENKEFLDAVVELLTDRIKAVSEISNKNDGESEKK